MLLTHDRNAPKSDNPSYGLVQQMAAETKEKTMAIIFGTTKKVFQTNPN